MEWAVVDNGIPSPDPFMRQAGVYRAENELDARTTLEMRLRQGAEAWLEKRTVTYGDWERA